MAPPDLPRLARPGWLSPFVLADGSGLARWQTRARVGWTAEHLQVRWECEDEDAWGTFRRRDDPLWQEEVVEIFLAPISGAGAEDPREYFEIELSPLGTLFDARVSNPTLDRVGMVVDPSWDCAGLRWEVGPGTARQDWWAEVEIPWASLLGGASLLDGRESRPLSPPGVWRLNLYRVERPRGGPEELSCWSPTLTDPPDFHRPRRFGWLETIAP